MPKCILTEQVPPGLTTGDPFEITLTVEGWKEKKQKVTNVKFLNDDSQNYIVGPKSASYDEYTTKCVRAEDITESGSITFSCKETPETPLQVEILRLEVRRNG